MDQYVLRVAKDVYQCVLVVVKDVHECVLRVACADVWAGTSMCVCVGGGGVKGASGDGMPSPTLMMCIHTMCDCAACM